MGLSGMRGKVLVGGSQLIDEVTKFTIVGSVNTRKYGSDKSDGWQRTVSGVRGLTITLDAMVVGSIGHLQEGTRVALELSPLGPTCGVPAAGWAVIEQISYTDDNERGEPVSYSATLSSDGPWTGLGNADWGGFENGCGQ